MTKKLPGKTRMKSYCLTVEVASENIKSGLGYMVAFRLPEGVSAPAALPEFGRWQEEVRTIVLRAGDLCFYPDAYTKKLAIAEMVHDLSLLNDKYAIQITAFPRVPTVQIHSTNPFDPIIEISFAGAGDHYKVFEKDFCDLHRPAVSGHGKTGLTEAARKHFPFKKAEPRAKPSPHRGFSPA